MNFKRISASIFSIMLLAGIVAISNSTASAQWNNGGYGNRNWDGYPNWGGNGDLRQTALNAGFNDGMKAGQKDLNKNRRSNFNDFKEYRSATAGYNSRFGDRSLYQRYYRVGFEHGYAEPMANAGYNNGNGGWNNNNNGGWNNNNGGWNNNNNNNNGGWYNNNGSWTRNGNRNMRGRNWGTYGNYGGSFEFRQTALNAGYNEGIKEGRKDRNRGPRNFNDFSSYRNANTDYKSQNGDIGLYQRYYREGFENGYTDGMNGY